MIDATQIAAAMQVPCLLSGDMIQQMQLWEELYLNRAGWIRNRIRSCHIPANIAQELKRLTLTEFSATVHDAAELEQAVRRVLPKLRRKMDFGLAIGGLLLKPYFTAQGVSVDIVPQNAYLPVNYTDDSSSHRIRSQCSSASRIKSTASAKTETPSGEVGSMLLESGV